MILYHDRPIESALLEIGKGTLYFANKVSAGSKACMRNRTISY